VQLAEQQSLFDAGGSAPMMQSVQWIEHVMLGEIALGLCVIAVAFLGALMLTGRLPLRDGGRIVAGCFLVLGAPLIAAEFVDNRGELNVASTPPPPTPVNVPIESTRPDLPPANYDPYAGASLGIQ
jgi:type IV secretion system protein VirB2